MNFNDLVKQWNGKKGIPNPTNPDKETLKGQCVSLVRYYMSNVLEISLNGIYGDAKDYWYNRNKSPLNNYFDAIAYNKGMSFKKGDIFILGPTNDNKYGHIGLCFGESNQNQIHIFDSNYKNQRTCYDRWRGYDGLLGILRPKSFIQKNIDDDVEESIDFVDFREIFVINRVASAGYYALRDKPIDGKIIYKAKAGDYFIPITKSNKELSDGFEWYEVETYGGEICFIQFDPEYIKIENWGIVGGK